MVAKTRLQGKNFTNSLQVRKYLYECEKAHGRNNKVKVVTKLYTFLEKNNGWVKCNLVKPDKHGTTFRQLVNRKLKEFIEIDGWEDGRRFMGKF